MGAQYFTRMRQKRSAREYSRRYQDFDAPDFGSAFNEHADVVDVYGTC